jgi:hypothetical protein
MQKLLEKLKKSRQTDIQVGGYTFTIQRLNDFDLGEIIEIGKINPRSLCKKCVVGWSLTELDLVPGGDPIPAAFDQELFIAWVAEKNDIWTALYEHIWSDYRQRNGLLEDQLGEANAGLSADNSQTASNQPAVDASQLA